MTLFAGKFLEPKHGYQFLSLYITFKGCSIHFLVSFVSQKRQYLLDKYAFVTLKFAVRPRPFIKMQMQGGSRAIKQMIARNVAIRIFIYIFSYRLHHVESADTNESVATTDCVDGFVGLPDAG